MEREDTGDREDSWDAETCALSDQTLEREEKGDRVDPAFVGEFDV